MSTALGAGGPRRRFVRFGEEYVLSLTEIELVSWVMHPVAYSEYTLSYPGSSENQIMKNNVKVRVKCWHVEGETFDVAS